MKGWTKDDITGKKDISVVEHRHRHEESLVKPQEWPIVIMIEPMGKPRMTQRDKWSKRPCVQRYWRFKDEIKKAFWGVDISNIHNITVCAYISMPKSWSNKKKSEMIGKPHRVKPDCDNILKAVMDSIFDDDSGISSAVVGKAWNDGKGTRLEITLM